MEPFSKITEIMESNKKLHQTVEGGRSEPWNRQTKPWKPCFFLTPFAWQVNVKKKREEDHDQQLKSFRGMSFTRFFELKKQQRKSSPAPSVSTGEFLLLR